VYQQQQQEQQQQDAENPFLDLPFSWIKFFKPTHRSTISQLHDFRPSIQLVFFMLLPLPSLEGALRQEGDNCVACIIFSKSCFFTV
jgi:hypothetical protein